MKRIAVCAALTFLLCPFATATEFDFLSMPPYRPEAPTPEAFLGYPLGSLHTHHYRMQDYFEALAEAIPDRVELRTYGESYERKDLFLAVVTSAANLARIEQIRTQNVRLADPRLTSDSVADDLTRSAPIIIWLDYGNDGNETANVEAAMQVAYQIAAAESEAMKQIRDRAIVIIAPDHNPESHDRHVAWYNAFGIGDPDPKAMEHHAPWGMSTNNNHYQIDLNRDAWPMSQRENQAVAAEILRWHPQVLIDHHGQTENYFFGPPAAPLNPSLPDSHGHWYEVLGRGTANAFDQYGWQYFVRDIFDIYYPGYWDSWPALHGALALTYETDGGGSRGLAWRKQDGSIVTFRDGIARHFVASLATVETAVANRDGIMRDFRTFFVDAQTAGAQGRPTRAYVLDPGLDPRKCAALVGTLLRHGIEVQRTTAAFSGQYKRLDSAAAQEVDFAPGSYLIDLAQPDQRMIETLFEPDPELDSDFVLSQLAMWSRNARRGEGGLREGHKFYDLTSWSLPIAFGVDAYALDQLPGVATLPVEASQEFLAGSGFWSDEVPASVPSPGGLFSRISGVDEVMSESTEDQPARSTYLFSPMTEGSMRLVANLLAEDFRVSVSTKALQVGATEFPRGTFVVQATRNPDSLHTRLGALSRDAGVRVVAADTAFAAQGRTGPGSGAVKGLRKPHVAMIADEGVSITEYGAAWFHLEQRLGYPFTPIRIKQLLDADLDNLDVLIVPQGSSSHYEHAFGVEGLDKLRSWIERGGSLVVWGSGPIGWLQDTEVLATRSTAAEEPKETTPDDSSGEETLATIDALAPDETTRPPVVNPSADPGSMQSIPGAVVRARLDLTHWMTIGSQRDTQAVLVRGSGLLQLSPLGQNPIVFSSGDDLRIGGFFWPGNTERWLADTAYLAIEPLGKGQVIAFAHDPNFRLAWRATSRFFSNALILGPTLGTKATPGL